MAQISPIKFSNELQKQLFPDNSFYKKSRTETGIGADVESVEIPIAGDVGAALSGNPTLPVAITARTDTKKSYSVEQLYTKPYLVTREESIVLNYDKITDLATSLSMSIETRAGNIAATEWGATLAANIVRSTGSTARASAVTGTTGNRKRIIEVDMQNVRLKFNKMNLPALGRNSIWGILTPEMVEDLLLIDKFVDADKTGELSKLKNGEIAYILGMNLMMRNNDINSTGVMYNVDATVKRTVDETLAVTDNAAAIFWHQSMVRHAEGHAETIINRKPAGYLGATVIESVVRFGATFDRLDQKGIVALVETNA
ncbi:MAG: phage capsid protein [Spirochaetota bacterium]|nr:phage capsid protein [Spirochaetota bacterium]